MNEVARLVSARFPNAPTTAARKVPEPIAVRTVSAACCSLWRRKQMSALLLVRLVAVHHSPECFAHLRQQVRVVVGHRFRLVAQLAPITRLIGKCPSRQSIGLPTVRVHRP
ncbi:MAG TPA: hypothetical protein VFV01_08580 [Spirillospora sp.]|nr:hypothetical protein [Spirillospora sp.]